MSEALGPEDIQFLERQESLLRQVISSIQSSPRDSRVDLREIAENIRTLNEEIKVGKEDDLPGLYYQLNIQHQLAERYSKPQELPDLESPYFGYMRLREGKKVKVVLLGHVAFLAKDADFRIVDWKKAPIARLFYQYEEGEEYELDLPERILEGVVEEHAILTIDNGLLKRVDRNGKSFIRTDEGWQSLEESLVRLEGGEGRATRHLGTGLTGFKGQMLSA